jgi:hypothetical protein
MQHLNTLTQAYSQTPWRKQLQLVGAFLLALVTVWLIAALYLDVTTRAATIGREIQEMQIRSGALTVNSELQTETDRLSIEELEQIIADLQTQLAYLTSERVMEARAIDLGFQPLDAEQIVYVKVPGYIPRQAATLAPPPGPAAPSVPVYNLTVPQSLGAWLQDQAAAAYELVKGAQP